LLTTISKYVLHRIQAAVCHVDFDDGFNFESSITGTNGGRGTIILELTSLSIVAAAVVSYCAFGARGDHSKRPKKLNNVLLDEQMESNESSSSKVSTAQHKRQLSQRRRKENFLREAGDDYGYRNSELGFIDNWRPRELPNLLQPNCSFGSVPCEREVYLDYAGAALPHRQQLQEIMQGNLQNILANPHSTGPAAARTSLAVEQVKKQLLDLWHGHPGKLAALGKGHALANGHGEYDVEDFHPGYEVFFTSGTTQALQIVAENFPWQSASTADEGASSTLVYPMNSHTSVIGMRGPALAKGAAFECWNMAEIENAIQGDQFVERITRKRNQTLSDNQNSIFPNLLVFPAECNFSGEKVSVESLVAQLHKSDRAAHGDRKTWWTMVDLAKAACTSPLHLRRLDMDFACVSFYKIFGEPTGLGCLLVKRSALPILSGPGALTTEVSPKASCLPPVPSYFGGGSVDVVLPRQDYVVRRGAMDSESSSTPLTHGTIHFRGIVALEAGLKLINRMGGMGTIERHVRGLSLELVRRLEGLVHSNGTKAIEVYGPRSPEAGPIVAFNVLRSDGSYVGYNEVAKLASLNRNPIQLRMGCFCNPGACQIALNKSDNEIVYNYATVGHVCGDDNDIVDGKPTGAIRVSIGKDSIWEDVDSLLLFLDQAFVDSDAGAVEREDAWDGVPRQVILTELFVYPIKSCRAQRVARWPLERETLRPMLDREFALVDAFGTAMRLQRYPRMAFISPEINLERRTMTVSAPGQEPLIILLDECPGVKGVAYGEGIVKVCGNRCGGVLWGDPAVSKWFSDYLGVQCWLARHSAQSSAYQAPTSIPGARDESVASRGNKRDSSIAFANEQPLLLISEHAVEVLNGILSQQGQQSVSSRHFRPNLVVRFAGSHMPYRPDQQHAEDGWTSLRVLDDAQNQKMEFEVVGQCARCSMVDVDPSSGTQGQALRALAGYRRSNGQITFGIFLKHTDNDGLSSSALWLEEGAVLLCE